MQGACRQQRDGGSLARRMHLEGAAKQVEGAAAGGRAVRVVALNPVEDGVQVELIVLNL